MGRVVVVTGTGTGIGKTYLACRLVSLFSSRGTACGFKPVETGVVGRPADAEALRAVSSFHVKHLLEPPFLFREGVSPHLAAREEGRTISIEPILSAIAALRDAVDLLVIELAGGLFTPLGPDLPNAALIRAIEPERVILVAPDRLGVLHDLGATTRAARTESCRLDVIVLNAPPVPDDSTGRNAAEVGVITTVPVVGPVPRSPPGPEAETSAKISLLLGFLL